MSRLSGGGLRRVTFRIDERAWPAALVLLYAVPALAAWGGGAVSARVLLLSLLLGGTLIALTEIDRTSFRLPDRLTLALVVGGLAAAAVNGNDVLWHLFSAALGLALIVLTDQIYRAVRGVAGIGLGDAKLFAASGAWLGAEGLPSVLLWACASALLVVVLGRAMGRRLDAQTAIPFGPFLALGTWIVWCLGPLN
jgi:leader peptidase (prepilin peptidase)/N-methyltransferase